MPTQLLRVEFLRAYQGEGEDREIPVISMKPRAALRALSSRGAMLGAGETQRFAT